MASSTTNLGLRKPATTENWNVETDFNANMEKIDAYVGKHNLGSFATLSALEDALNALGATMNHGDCLDIYFTMTAAVGLFSATGYIGRIMKVLNAVRYRVIVYQNGSNLEFDGVQWGGTSWTWQRLALNSQIENLHGLSETKNLAAVTDLNICKYAGAYAFNTSTSNTPAGYGVCFVIATNVPDNSGMGWVAQFAFTTSRDWKLYMRTNINNSGWTAWKSITFT